MIFGYGSVALATLGIAFISFGVWAHHMFAVGMSPTLDLLFAGASYLIAVPTGIKMFNWNATLYGGKLWMTTALWFCIGFLCQFLCGGLTGIMLATAPWDWQVTHSYFVVAHFHYVLLGGTLFAIMAGLYYWFPKMTGRMMSERLGRWHFWLMVLGFNLTFGPMHIVGMLGMPRRIYTYHRGLGWESWNLLATIGAIVLAASLAVFFWNFAVSCGAGSRPATTRGTPGPWNGLRRRRPRRTISSKCRRCAVPVPCGISSIPTILIGSTNDPEIPAVSAADRSRNASIPLPSPTAESAEESSRPDFHKVGMVCFLCSEAAFFGTLLTAYATYLGKSLVGPYPAVALGYWIPAANTLFLVGSSVTVALAAGAFARGRQRGFLFWLGVTFALGFLFLCGTAYEWTDLIGRQGLTLQRNLFGTTFFTLIGFHAGHVTLGLLIMLILGGLVLARRLEAGRSESVELFSWYWHFVDAVWVTIIVLVYVVGR